MVLPLQQRGLVIGRLGDITPADINARERIPPITVCANRLRSLPSLFVLHLLFAFAAYPVGP